MAQQAKKLPAMQDWRCGFNPWVRKIPWKRKGQPTPVFLSKKSDGQRSLGATVQMAEKSHMRLSTSNVLRMINFNNCTMLTL